MSYIESINQAATASAQTQKSDTDKTKDIMGKEDFLTLLVTQLKNQDPLNPDEPTEFTAQLAQFSSLEQLFNLNESMEQMATSVGDSQKLSALSMIGKEVTYADSSLNYEGEPVQLGYSIDGPAKEVMLHLQQNGATVATIQGTGLTQGNHFVTWDGTTLQGTPAPQGQYTVVVKPMAAEESIAAAPLIRSEVTGVDLEGDKGGLLFTKAGQVSVNDIKGVYDASTALSDEQTEQAETELGSQSDAPTQPLIDTQGEETVTETVAGIAEETVPTDG
jgi:flagellar basal-body rod modification protein FlgD